MEDETVVWAAGVRASPLADALGVTLGRGARVRVAPTLELPGHTEVCVVGDMAYLEQREGEPYPMVAQVAMQMGKHAGRAILARTRGRPRKPFSYFDFGQMAMVGRGAAVFESHGLRLRGPIAWLIWLGIHLAYLPGLRSRMTALLAWVATVATGEAPIRGSLSDVPAAPRDTGRLRPAA